MAGPWSSDLRHEVVVMERSQPEGSRSTKAAKSWPVWQGLVSGIRAQARRWLVKAWGSRSGVMMVPETGHVGKAPWGKNGEQRGYTILEPAIKWPSDPLEGLTAMTQKWSSEHLGGRNASCFREPAMGVMPFVGIHGQSPKWPVVKKHQLAHGSKGF